MAVVVDREQAGSAGFEGGGGRCAWVGVEGGAFPLERGGEPQLDRSVLVAGGRESLAGGVERDAGDWAVGYVYGARELIAVDRVPDLDDPAQGAGHECSVGRERQRHGAVFPERMKRLADLIGRGVEDQNAGIRQAHR